MTRPTPERALRLALIGWGLGDLAMGRSRAALVWMALEAAMLAATSAATILLADTTWYLVPFLMGVAFLVIWAGQAVATYRRAQRLQSAAAPSQPRSPAAIVAWLTLPLLAWGTGFWLVAAGAATPAAVVDRFVSRWADLEVPSAAAPTSGDDIDRVAGVALANLAQLCAIGRLAADCGDATENLLRDVRVTIDDRDGTHATADAQLVEYRRQPSTLFGIFEGSELVPVPITSVLRLQLEAVPAALGAGEWVIVNAEAP